MNLTVYQTIAIQTLKVETVSNASILQIGTAGCVQALAQLYNTGGFAEPAYPGKAIPHPILVPLPSPR